MLLDPIVEKLRALSLKPTVRGNRVRALCPGHPDIRPSLVVSEETDKVLFHCFAGCRPKDLLVALDLTWADVYRDRPSKPSQAAWRMIAEYPYYELDGGLAAIKRRYEPKAFRWFSVGVSGGLRPGLQGRRLPLYRLPDLIDYRRVCVTEGEKATEALWNAGFAATCGPTGASGWRPEYGEALWRCGCAEVIVLPDCDRAGRQYARAVAEALHGLAVAPVGIEGLWPDWPLAQLGDPECEPLQVKLVELPGLAHGEDVADFLERHAREHLRDIIERAPFFCPARDAETTLARRREQNRLRQRRWRERHA